MKAKQFCQAQNIYFFAILIFVAFFALSDCKLPTQYLLDSKEIFLDVMDASFIEDDFEITDPLIDKSDIDSYSVFLDFETNSLPENFIQGGLIESKINNGFLELYASQNGEKANSFLQIEANFAVNTALTINFWADIRSDLGQNFLIYADGLKAKEWAKAVSWQKASLVIEKGQHLITLELVSNSTQFLSNKQHAVYIDSISIVPNRAAKINVYPRGQQETFLYSNNYQSNNANKNSTNIRFKPQVLRCDGSRIEVLYKDFDYKVSSCGYMTHDGIFVPEKAGTCTVEASFAGVVGKSQTISVFQEDYMHLPFVYNGQIYNGQTNEGLFYLPNSLFCNLKSPKTSGFDADGFFLLEGCINNKACYDYALVIITKDSEPQNYYMMFVQGIFCTRIWLRYGQGKYTVTINKITNKCFDKDGSGDWTQKLNYYPSLTIKVNNTRNENYQSGDGRFIYPSAVVQSDSLRISNFAKNVLFGQKSDREIIKSLHHATINILSYDYDSLIQGNRSKQDSELCLATKKAVCEGYANTLAALLRCSGIETKVISNKKHSWNSVKLNEKWYLIDATWNDNGTYSNDNYFLIADENNGEHNNSFEVAGRAIFQENTIVPFLY